MAAPPVSGANNSNGGSGMSRFATIRRSETIALVLVGTILLGSGAAMAQMKGNFADADANHDGRVTLQEFQAS